MLSSMMMALAASASQPATPPQPAPTPRETCAAIARLLAAARERPAFESVRQALVRGENVVPGFPARSCQIDRGGSLDCGLSSMEARIGPAPGEPLRCRGLRQEAQPQSPRRFPNTIAHSYTARGLRISHGVTCLGCAGPARRFFRIALERPAVAR